jgi:hypothetical protein
MDRAPSALSKAKRSCPRRGTRRLPVYQAVGEDLDRARAAWAFAHGMTNLDLNGRFPPDAGLAGAWERGVQGAPPTLPPR